MSYTHELSWAAGFFDGEGFITIQERNHPNYIGYYLRIGINHVAPEPIMEMHRIFGGTITKQNPEKVVGNRKVRYRWQMGTSAAALALKKMMPYFKNKNKVAALALDFQETIKNEYKRVGVPSNIQEKRQWFKAEITKLNSLD